MSQHVEFDKQIKNNYRNFTLSTLFYFILIDESRTRETKLPKKI